MSELKRLRRGIIMATTLATLLSIGWCVCLVLSYLSLMKAAWVSFLITFPLNLICILVALLWISRLKKEIQRTEKN